MYLQCHLRRRLADGCYSHTIGFIPEKFVYSGKPLRLTLGNKETDGWEIVSAGRERFPHSLLVRQSQDYKRMRKASDI